MAALPIIKYFNVIKNIRLRLKIHNYKDHISISVQREEYAIKRFICSLLLVLLMILEVGCRTTAENIKSDSGPFLVHWEQGIPKGYKAIWHVTYDRGEEPRFDHHLHIKTHSGIVIISRITDPGPAAAIRARNNPELMRITARYKIRNNGWKNGKLKKKIVVPNQKWVVEIQSDNDTDPEWVATLEIKPL